MKKLLLLFVLMQTIAGYGQNIRIDFMAGLSNYYGEIQSRKLSFVQANPLYSIGASVDLTNHFSLRATYSITRLGADDKRGYYPARNLNFKTDLTEGNLLIEYNLWDLSQKSFTPYIFSGVGKFNFNPYTVDSVDRKIFLQELGTEGQGLPEYPDRTPYKKTQFNIPVGGGLKYAISEDVYFSFEYGLRILFTDYLDDISTTYVDENVLLRGRGPVAVAVAFRGDELKSNPKPYPRGGFRRGSNRVGDLYYFGVARLSIRMPWFESGTGRGVGNKRSRLGCPGRVL